MSCGIWNVGKMYVYSLAVALRALFLALKSIFNARVCGEHLDSYDQLTDKITSIVVAPGKHQLVLVMNKRIPYYVMQNRS